MNNTIFTIVNNTMSTNKEKKQSRILKTLSIVHDYLCDDSSGIIEEYLVKNINNSCMTGMYGIDELITDDNKGLLGACRSSDMDFINLIVNEKSDVVGEVDEKID